MTTTAEKAHRRNLEFTTLDEVRADIETVAAGSYVTVGQWSFAQILDHLGSSLNASLDGFPFKGSWFVRWCVSPFIKNSILTKQMKPGFRLPKKFSSYLPSEDCTMDDALHKVLTAIKRFEKEIPVADHPFFGKMASEEWMCLHLRHAELHLSFVVPTASAGEQN
ncbi:MAG: DUF1569 domain-containing protein [Rhodopirellula sp.]|nr:DUF1569 domain-containing protein [Rhodopirellula sp.]